MTITASHITTHAKLETHIFDGDKKGPHVWISGNLHGNEHAGSVAIDRTREEIENGAIKLEKGRLVLVPRVNTVGIERNTRFVDSDLNRRVIPWRVGEINTLEDILRQKLVRRLDWFYSDSLEGRYVSGASVGFPGAAIVHTRHPAYLLDLHSFHAPGEPHVWVYGEKHSHCKKDVSFAEAIGVPRILCGWASAYTNTTDPDELKSTGLLDRVRVHLPDIAPLHWPAPVEHWLIRKELRRLATTIGQRAYDRKISSITVECGQHEDPATAEFAYQAIRRTLDYAGLTQAGQMQAPRPTKIDYITVKRVIFRLAGDELARPFTDLERLTPGEPIVKGTKRVIFAPTQNTEEDTLILFPNQNAKTGSELAYLATLKRPTDPPLERVSSYYWGCWKGL